MRCFAATTTSADTTTTVVRGAGARAATGAGCAHRFDLDAGRRACLRTDGRSAVGGPGQGRATLPGGGGDHRRPPSGHPAGAHHVHRRGARVRGAGAGVQRRLHAAGHVHRGAGAGRPRHRAGWRTSDVPHSHRAGVECAAAVRRIRGAARSITGGWSPRARTRLPQQQYGMVVGIPNAGQVNALSTLNLRGERSVTCKGDFDKATGPLPAGAPAACDAFRKQPDALERAAQLDAQYGRNPDLKKLPMYCVVMSFKDVYDTADMRTTGGADTAYAMDAPPKDSTIVSELRARAPSSTRKPISPSPTGAAATRAARPSPPGGSSVRGHAARGPAPRATRTAPTARPVDEFGFGRRGGCEPVGLLGV